MTVTVPAFAKINLFLDIASLRDDGYHNIISYMQSVSLADKITVSYIPKHKKTISITCNDPKVPLSNKNLAYQAADIFPSICGEININIEKNIPMEAGLAGGSTDAAATLVALNSLCDKKLSPNELLSLSAGLGADVPFCVMGGAAIAEGIGEILTPAKSMPYLPIVIAKKGEGMSTPAAYKALDYKYSNFKNYNPHSDMLKNLLDEKAYNNTSIFSTGLFNVFESVVEEQRREIGEIKAIMNSDGAIKSMMSGSGTSVFGIFKNESDASRAASALESYGATVHICNPVK